MAPRCRTVLQTVPLAVGRFCKPFLFPRTVYKTVLHGSLVLLSGILESLPIFRRLLPRIRQPPEIHHPGPTGGDSETAVRGDPHHSMRNTGTPLGRSERRNLLVPCQVQQPDRVVALHQIEES